MRGRLKHRSALLIVAASLLVSSATARAQNDARSTDSTTTLRRGARALQFQIRSNLLWTSLQGATLSYQKMFSDHSGWRVGLSLDVSATDNKITDSTSATETYTTNLDGQSYGVTWQYVHYPAPESRLGLFWETGPFTSYSRTKNADSYRDQLTHSWTLGWGTDVGVEWFASRRISLRSQYGVQLSYQRSSVAATQGAPGITSTYSWSNTVSHTYRIGSAPVTLGVSLFF